MEREGAIKRANAGREALAWLGTAQAAWLGVGVGVLLRLAVLGFVWSKPLAGDGADYHQMARQLASGEGFTPYWPPGLPCYLLAAHTLFGATEQVSRVATLALYPLFCWLLYGLTRRYDSPPAGGLALFLFAFYPAFVHLSVEPMTQLPTAVCLLAILYLLTGETGAKFWRRAAALGGVLGVIILLRPSNGLLALVAFAWMRQRCVRWGQFALCLATLTLIVGLWLWKAERLAGRFIPVNTANAINLFKGNNPYTPLYKTWWLGSHFTVEEGVAPEYLALTQRIDRLPEAEANRTYQRLTLEHIAARPDLFAARTLNRMRCFFGFDTFTASFFKSRYGVSGKATLALLALDALFYLALGVGALCYLFSRPAGYRPRSSPVLAAILAVAAPYWISFAHPTYHFPVVPVWGIWAAVYFVERFAEERREPIVGKRKMGLILTLALFAYIQLEWLWMMRGSA